MLIGTRGTRRTSPSPDHSLCESPIITKRVKSPEKDLAAIINTDSNICTLKRFVYLYNLKITTYIVGPLREHF